jgi:hypothetical protein
MIQQTFQPATAIHFVETTSAHNSIECEQVASHSWIILFNVAD